MDQAIEKMHVGQYDYVVSKTTGHAPHGVKEWFFGAMFDYISLYMPNDYHANDAGAYLTACVFASTLFGLHIKDITDSNIYHGDDAIKLGQAVWEYVSYYDENKASPAD